MLELVIPGQEYFDENKQEFVTMKDVVLRLEHSLLSISKWESKWHKPYFNQEKIETDSMLDYIRCMTINTPSDSTVYSRIDVESFNKITEYINDKHTATWFTEKKDNELPQRGPRLESITSELIYYWMIAYNIPFECEKWHINKLLTLIRVCHVKSTPPKKQSKKEMLQERAALNAVRRAKYGSGS